ncbi:MAG: glycosyltransferase [Anaerolineae bacterium]
MKKRILFLISDTGGGHRAAAQAIEEAIHHLYPNTYQTIIEDIWKEHTPWPVNKIPGTYPWMLNRGMPMWRLMWAMSTIVKPHKVVFPGVSPVLKKQITHYFEQVNPHIIVSVHPLMNHIGLKLKDKAGLGNVPFVTVVTDMVSVHPAWICPRVTFCTVPTEPAYRLALKFGLPPEKVMVTGQPVGLKFAAAIQNKQRLKEQLGLYPERRTILVAGGGEGHGRVLEIARAIAATVCQAQMIIVAGRNAALQQTLSRIAWEIPTQIYGFVNNMPELMGAADILVTKAGPGTLSEALIARLPLIISGYIPGQETGNVSYIQQHRAGLFVEDPPEIARLVNEWVNPDNPSLQQMVCNAAALAKPRAALTIAAKVRDLVEN